ncbi:unnamed protein product [Lupinus luteus]|uniref:Seven-in-absentia protein TRAF-like domain-containing protein n=1 Tax=Lupinus luteus TaxID=3873 RepID=A0AAV1VZ48_LUPLU
MLEENEHSHHQFSSSISKLHCNVPTTTSVHDLLECSVCTNSTSYVCMILIMMSPEDFVAMVEENKTKGSRSSGERNGSSLNRENRVVGELYKRRGARRSSEVLLNPCHNGHTLCSTCKARVHNRCPTCRQELGDIRPYNCPYAGSDCSAVGDIPYLVAHLRDDHRVDMHSRCTFNHRYVKSNPTEVENATWMLTVFHCFGQYFCLHFEAFQLGMSLVYMAFLRFMGDERETQNYSYSLEVGGNERKLTFEGGPRSIRDSHKKVRDSHDGLVIYRNMALFFSGVDKKELKLRVTGRIWKEQQNFDGEVCIPNMRHLI